MSCIIYYLENCQNGCKIAGQQSQVWKKGAPAKVNVLKQYAFKVSQSGLLRIMEGGLDSCGQNLWACNKKEEKKESQNFFFQQKY